MARGEKIVKWRIMTTAAVVVILAAEDNSRGRKNDIATNFFGIIQNK